MAGLLNRDIEFAEVTREDARASMVAVFGEDAADAVLHTEISHRAPIHRSYVVTKGPAPIDRGGSDDREQGMERLL